MKNWRQFVKSTGYSDNSSWSVLVCDSGRSMKRPDAFYCCNPLPPSLPPLSRCWIDCQSITVPVRACCQTIRLVVGKERPTVVRKKTCKTTLTSPQPQIWRGWVAKSVQYWIVSIHLTKTKSLAMHTSPADTLAKSKTIVNCDLSLVWIKANLSGKGGSKIKQYSNDWLQYSSFYSITSSNYN